MGRLSGSGSLLDSFTWKHGSARATKFLDCDSDDWWSPRAASSSTKATPFTSPSSSSSPKLQAKRGRSYTHDSSAQDDDTDVESWMFSSCHSTTKITTTRTRSKSLRMPPTTATYAHMNTMQPINTHWALASFKSSTRSRPHAASQDLCESDFAPIAMGSVVSTRFGFGVLESYRADGTMVVQLQATQAPHKQHEPVAKSVPGARLYLSPEDDECFAVPAMLYDWVQTSVGQGRVMGFNAAHQVYAVRISGQLEFLAHVPSRDVRRVAPPRQTTIEGFQRQQKDKFALPHLLHKSLSTAFRALKAKSTTATSGSSSSQNTFQHQHQCVVTSLGEGTIRFVDHAQKRTAVTLTTGATVYLDLDAVMYFTKAISGMEVMTKFGPGIVMAVRPEDALYTVRLQASRPKESDIVYVHESDLSKISEPSSNEDTKGSTMNKLVAFAHERKTKLFGGISARADSKRDISRTDRSCSLNLVDDEVFDVEPITAGI